MQQSSAMQSAIRVPSSNFGGNRTADIANRWVELLGYTHRYPQTFVEYNAACHSKGQTKPTPLMLKYSARGYNRLHQDLYGDMVFPFQCTVLLSAKSEYKKEESFCWWSSVRARNRAVKQLHASRAK